MDQPRLALGLGLAAQVADVDLQRVGRRGEVVAPDLLEDERPLEHPPRPPEEHLEQRELGPGELDLPLAPADLPGGDVHREVGEAEHLVGVLGLHRAAHQRPQPRQQLGQRERLGEVVVGPGVQPLDPVADGVAGGEDEDRHVVPGGPQRAGRLEAVEPRHHHVHHDRVGPGAGDAREGLRPVAGERDVVAVELEGPSQRVADGPVVVDDEHAGAGAGSHGPTVPPVPESCLRARPRARTQQRRGVVLLSFSKV